MKMRQNAQTLVGIVFIVGGIGVYSLAFAAIAAGLLVLYDAYRG